MPRKRERIAKARDIELINGIRAEIGADAQMLLEELRKRLHELRRKEQQWHDDVWRDPEAQ